MKINYKQNLFSKRILPSIFFHKTITKFFSNNLIFSIFKYQTPKTFLPLYFSKERCRPKGGGELSVIALIITSFLLINIGFTQNAISEPFNKYSELRQKIDDLVFEDKELKKALVGIKIKDLVKNKDIYYLNTKNYFVPASNMKIFTTLISLEKLGKDFSFKTTISTDGYIEDAGKKIKGNLYLNFSGDPTFKTKDLVLLFDSIKNKGITKVTGNLIINKSVFDDKVYGTGWMYDDFNDCYSAPVDALTIDDNCINYHVKALENDKIDLQTDNYLNADTSGIEIANETASDIYVKEFTDSNTLFLAGKIAKGKNIELEQSILSPEKYLKKILIDLLKNNGKDSFLDGEIIISDEKKITKVIAEHNSIPLKEILKKFDKESHNLTGELLLKTVGLEENKTQGSTKSGIESMKKYLENKFFTTEFSIADGSGLSRYNMVTPSLIMSILEYMYNSDDFRQIILDAFPLGGVEGTLKNRLKNFKVSKVVAKSGSMTGVNCLSGYLLGNKGEVIAFSIMVNNSRTSGKYLRNFQDKILEEVENLLILNK